MLQARTFLKALIRYWWAFMSCAAFTLLSVWVLYAGKSNAWTLNATLLLAFAFFLIASFLPWRDMYRRAIDAEKALAALPMWNRDWEQVSTKMLECGQGIFLECGWTNPTDQVWSIKGGYKADICKAWLTQAGRMLIESPNVKLEVPVEIANEPDDFIRWCLYLKSKMHFRLSPLTVLYDKSLTRFEGTTVDVNLISARLCEEFAAKEFKR